MKAYGIKENNMVKESMYFQMAPYAQVYGKTVNGLDGMMKIDFVIIHFNIQTFLRIFFVVSS
jgi:hypothetical protein